MERDTARRRIEDLIGTGTPVHPQTARDLYTAAELPIPEHLQVKPMTEEERAQLAEMGRQVTEAFFRKGQTP